MGWLAWASIGYLFNAIALAVDKSLLGRRDMGNPAVYTLFISILGLLVLVLAPWGWQWPSQAALAYGLSSGVCFTVGLWLMFSVLKYGEASRVPAFIGALNPVFVFLGSWWLMAERLGPISLVAFLALVLGGLVMVGGKGGLRGKGLGMAILASVIFGLAYVAIKQTFLETNFISGLILIRLGGFASSLLLFIIPGTVQELARGIKRTGAGTKLAFLGGQSAGALSGLLNSYAITLGSVTLVNALQGEQYVFLLILSAVISFKYPNLFRDEFSGQVVVRKALGTVLVGVGLLLLSLN